MTALPAHQAPTSTGVLDDDPTRIRLFDFSRQETIERGRLRLLRPMLETVAGRIASTLTSGVRQIVRASMPEDFLQQSWEEYAPSLPDPSYISTAIVTPLERRFVMHVPVPLAFLLLDYSLGGDGQSQPERDELTDMERALLDPLIETLWRDSIVPPLSSFLDLGVGGAQSSGNPIFVQIGRPGEICLIAELQMAVADSDSFTVALALPVSTVGQVIDSIERLHSGEAIGANDAMVTQVERNLEHVPVEIKVSYPSVRFTPTELVELQVGDVLPLRPRAEIGHDLLEVLVGDVLFARGVLVEEGRNLSVSITSLEEAS